MFRLLSELIFWIIRPIVYAVMTSTGYSDDAKKRKMAYFEDCAFDKNDNVIMVHGVSVGEINALENLVKEIRKTFTDSKIVLTTGTHTGQDIAYKKLGDYVDYITYFPFDCPSVVNRFLDKLCPSKVLIAETEIWPNFARECFQRGIKLYIINGRISDKSFKSYKNFKFLFKNFFKFYTGIYTQSDEDNDKFVKIGADKNKTKRMNNLKFDIKKPDVDIILDKKESKIFLAGSTHQGEDEIVLDVFSKLRQKHRDLKLVLAPRHLTRKDEVIALIEKTGFAYELRSNGINSMDGIDILLLDTLGELGKMYSFADISFIGGSFSNTGGHNPLESVIFSKPVISGPSINNFKDIYSIIKNSNSGYVVKNSEEFYDIANKLLEKQDFYNEIVQNCSNVFESQQGALKFVIDLLKSE